MSRMYGERINEFVLSIDLIDDETFVDLLDLIQQYVSSHLNVTYFSILVETTINDREGLRTLRSTREEKPSYTVDKEDGYTSHTAYAYGENKPVWVVCSSKNLLKDSTDLTDLWVGSEDLPAYSGSERNAVRTSVMHPLTKDGRAIGVIEFASEKYVEPTPASLEEVETLAEIVSRVLQMYDVQRLQRENTKRAMKILSQALDAETWTRLALPQLFIAYSGVERIGMQARADHEAVIDTIRDVVSEFSDKLEAVYWEDAVESGNINEQVIRDIGNSEFGICYFSEPTEQGSYEDNANVLFEAGMMQALAASPGALLRVWIPVREKDSESIPFDIASERILLVDRVDGKLDKTAFADSLRQRVVSFLDTPKRID